MDRAASGFGGIVEAVITRGFDRVFKRHDDEQAFWEGLFRANIVEFQCSGVTDWDRPASQRYYRLLLEDFRRLVGLPNSVLELGCGTAVLSLLLAANGSRVTLVDRNPAALEYAFILEHRLRADLTFLGDVTYVLDDFRALPQSLRAEVVHNAGVIEEMPTDQAVEVVRRMRSHAERAIVVAVPNFFNPYLLQIWRRGGKGTERYFSQRTLARVLRAAGLERVAVTTSSCIHPLLPAALNRDSCLGFLHIGVAQT